MERFFWKLLIYLVPFAVVLLVPATVLVVTGEFTPVGWIIELQASSPTPVLFGRAYSDPTARYKLASVVQRRPEIMALGTSRILAVRSTFFSENASFFNAGNGVTRLRHFRPFLQRIPPGAEPKLILLGLDQYLFNARFDSLSPDGMEDNWAGDRKIQDVFFESWIQVYRDYFERKFALADLTKSRGEKRVGLNAVVHANAFRNDGSYTWAQYVADPWNPKNEDYEFRNTLDRIANGYRRFEYGEHVSEAAVAELEKFLEDCKSRGIYVAAFPPPFAHLIYAKLRSMPVEYGYLRELEPWLRPVFAKFGYSLLDFSDLAAVGASDRETIDGFHGSEKAYVRLFLNMIENDPILRGVSRDPAYLRARLEAATGDQMVFGIAER